MFPPPLQQNHEDSGPAEEDTAEGIGATED